MPYLGQHAKVLNAHNKEICEALHQAANTNTSHLFTTHVDLWRQSQSQQMLYYYIHPTFNYKTGKIQYVTPCGARQKISVQNHATKTSTVLPNISPNSTKRTLGVMLAPSGQASTQIITCNEKIALFQGKLTHCNLPPTVLWRAIKYILQPAILYPLMATLYDLSNLRALEKKIDILYCQALGLNKHFPRAVLHGPCQLGGMEIPTLQSMLTIIHINYFLYHTRTQSPVGKKLELSIIHMQLEVGSTECVLTSSFDHYSHLSTHSLIKCLWAETEPYGLTIKNHSSISWIPQLQGNNDMAIRVLATRHFSPMNSGKINKCRIYLQVLTIYDLFTQNNNVIHREIKRGEWIQSHKSIISWPDIKKPPTSYWTLWKTFMKMLERTCPYTEAKSLHCTSKIPSTTAQLTGRFTITTTRILSANTKQSVSDTHLQTIPFL